MQNQQQHQKKALITGITGQDGSYLAEFLIGKGYEVHGIVRRSSSFNTDRLEHLYVDPHSPSARLRLHYGDLVDGIGLREILTRVRPDEVYNLGAQSHVRVSFEQPVYTVQSDAVGTINLLEAIRDTGFPTRFYQASSSEMYGKVVETPQTERTPFHPRSPYACAKVFSYWQTVNYREAYGMYAVNGILFNHECVTAETPVFVRRGGMVELLPIEDVVPHRRDPWHGVRYTTEPAEAVEVWDAKGWVPVTCMTATWNGQTQRRDAKPVHAVCARGAVYRATADHVVFVDEAGHTVERPAGEVKVGDRLPLINLPEPTEVVRITEEEAWLIGLLVAEGHVTPEGKVTATNRDAALLEQVAIAWRKVTGGGTSRYSAPSGFANGGEVTQLRLLGAREYGRLLRSELYTRSGDKRLPRRVLNADRAARLAFLRGFNAGDGLKSTPCTYEFQGFRTSSASLAAGLYWLSVTTLRQRCIVCVEDRDGRLYYQVNLNSPEVPGDKGQHLRRPLQEVTAARRVDYKGWLFDLATASGTFHAGIGQGWVHNSPRRGETFVTRKITRAATRIKEGLQDKLFLGNLDAKRDWGFAGDYVEAMWLMLQAKEPQDYVVATGETHSVREFLDEVFGILDLDWKRYVEVDPRYFRPAEVDLLLGDASKARRELGWQPRVTFKGLARLMTEADWKLAKREKLVRDGEREPSVAVVAP